MTLESTTRRANLLKAIGPGIVYAGAAIGVSHLVQSTRAGASYGFALLGLVLVATCLKYPFFEFGHRYAAATGQSMLTGYRRVGTWALVSFLLISFWSGMPTVAAVTLVSSGLAAQLFPGDLSAVTWSAILIGFTLALLAVGGDPWLDGIMKLMMAFLALSTVVAVIAALFYDFDKPAEPSAPGLWTAGGIAFVVTLLGGMPTPVGISAWPSLWMRERAEQTGHRSTPREALFDFNLGYLMTMVMAVLFLSLGAMVMFRSGVPLEGQAIAFAGQVVSMYTSALGGWSKPFILTAAFTCMLSTTLTVIDGYPRVLSAGLQEMGLISSRRTRGAYWVFNGALCLAGWVIIAWFRGRMLMLVTFVTTVAFLSAPLLAYLNHRAVHTADVPVEHRPPGWLRWLSVAGMVFLAGFSVLYLWVRWRGSGG